MANQQITMVDPNSNWVDAHNKIRSRDKGLFGDNVIWRYDGPEYTLDIDNPQGFHVKIGEQPIVTIKDTGINIATNNAATYALIVDNNGALGPHAIFGGGIVTIKDSGEVIATNDNAVYALNVNNAGSGGLHLTIAGSLVTFTNTAISSAVQAIIDDPAGTHLTLGTDKVIATDTGLTVNVDQTMQAAHKIIFNNAGNTNGANLYHSGTNDVLKTDDGLWVVGNLGNNNGAVPTAPLHVVKTQTGTALAILSQLGSAAGDVGLRVITAGTDAATPTFSVENATSSVNFGVYNAGLVAIGDNANAFMGIGLTINQLAGDNEAFACKSSDVAHGITGRTETDTYFTISKPSASSGGAMLAGFSEDLVGLYFWGVATNNNTTVGTSAAGVIHLVASKKSGSVNGSNDANANLFVVTDDGSARCLIDAEGDVKYDGATGAAAWDDYDDVALLEAFRVTTANPVNYRRLFSDDISRHAQILHDTGVITLNEDGHHFVSTKGLNGLLIDALRQTHGRVLSLEHRLLALEAP